MGCPFFFKTIEFHINAEVIERPKNGIARLACNGWAEGDAEHSLDVTQAWLNGLINAAQK